VRGWADFAPLFASFFASVFATWAAMGRAVSDISASAIPIPTAAFVLEMNRFRIFTPSSIIC
jgi:hypothetical protein